MIRIVSLLPSATEIVDCLGMTRYLVGRSHECDFPTAIQSLPICTAPKFSPEGHSQEIHDRVTKVLEEALSVYAVKTEVLQELQPTHIITQSQCEVCAVSLGDVQQAVAELTNCHPHLISLQPNFLHEIWRDIEEVGNALDVDYAPVVAELKARVERCRSLSAGLDLDNCPTIVCIEWIEPLMAAGNWIPELVQIAGGKSLFGEAGKHSPWFQWQELVASDPDVIVFMPCGFDLHKTAMEVAQAMADPKWHSLRAYQNRRIYITDGNSYFNRPGPRLVESVEILQEILHPHLTYGHEGVGWQKI
jgi:iron complex transport system substrate-binding protein